MLMTKIGEQILGTTWNFWVVTGIFLSCCINGGDQTIVDWTIIN
jgi:hypothetical protein